MHEWRFLTNHARALLFIARQPDARLHELAAGLEVTERTAYAIVRDLAAAGYVVKEKDGRRNRYKVQDHLAVPDAISQERTVGDLLAVLGHGTPTTMASVPVSKSRRSASEG